jgi:uncharacterized protein
MLIHRRDFLRTAALSAGLLRPKVSLANQHAFGNGTTKIAACWRGLKTNSAHRFGVIDINWKNNEVQISSSLELPSRPHGLCKNADGSISVFGVRPGRWIVRVSPQSELIENYSLPGNDEKSTLNGHGIATQDGKFLLTTETDIATGAGVIGIRDAASFKKVTQFFSGSIEPHQIVLDDEGYLWVANGGIRRNDEDKKMNLNEMSSSLVKISIDSGRVEQKWELTDRFLSLRHLAWNKSGQLGIAMQAEHPQLFDRVRAPVLSIFDGERLAIPTFENDSAGYAGDIAACGRGFSCSSHRSKQVLFWHPEEQRKLHTIATITEPCAMTAQEDSVLIAAALGVARWHPLLAPQFLAWPEPMAIDNHWLAIE